MAIRVRKIRVLRNLLVLFGASLALLWLARGGISASTPALLLGAAAGVGYGVFYWRRLLGRVQRSGHRHARNRVFVRFISPVEVLLVALGWNLAMLAAVLSLVLVLVLFNLMLGGWLAALAGSFGSAATAVLMVLLLRFEHRYGALYYQYASEAWAGAEGLLYQRGVAITDLSPAGQVRIRAENWRARSISGEPIGAGSRVEVLDQEGLCLIVDHIDDTPAAGGEKIS